MRRVFLQTLPLLFLVWIGVARGQEVQVIRVEGVADVAAGDTVLARERALEDAKRRAVEQSLGTLVAAQTLVQNYQVVNDQILTKAGGYVKSYRVLDEFMAHGLYRVVIEAQVTEIVDQVVQDQMALDLLLAWMERPVLLVVVREDLLGDRASQVAETELIRRFSESGFDLVDRAQVERLRGGNWVDRALAGERGAAGFLGKDLGAQLIIVGNAKATTGGRIYGKMISGQADITARAIRVDTGEPLATATKHGAKPHVSAATAATNALIEATDQLADQLIQDIVKRWSAEAVGTSRVELLVSGVDFTTLVELERELSRVPGIREVHRRSFQEGVARLEVRFQGKAGQLATLLTQRPFPGFQLTVTATSPHRITLKFVPESTPEGDRPAR